MTLSAEAADGRAAVAAPARGTTARVAAVLDALVRRGETGTGARELAADLQISRSSVHRILQVMSDLKVARVGSGGRYEPGARLLAWAGFLSEQHPVLRLGNDVLTKLAGEAGETALLVSYTWPDHGAVTIATCECAKPVRYTVDVGSPTPLHAGSAGKAILAHLPESLARELERPRLTEATVTDPAELRAQLDDVRRLGYAITVGERIPDAAGAAAPFFREGAVAGAVNLTIPRYRLDEPQLHAHGERVREKAARLTASLAAFDAEHAGGVSGSAAPGTEPGVPSDLYVGWTDRNSGVGQPTKGNAVARAIGVLDALARCPSGGATTERLAASLDTSVVTMRRMLEEFTRRRLAHGLRSGRWEAGQQQLALPGIVGHDSTIVRLSGDILDELVVAGGETVCLTRYDPTDGAVVFEAVHESRKPIRYATPVGSRAPLHAGAAGKAILAYLDWELAAVQCLVRFTDATIVDPDALRRDLAETRERGYAVSVGERIPEAVGVAGAYFRDGHIAGSLTIMIPHHRFDATLLPTLGHLVAAAAGELTRLLSTTGGARSTGG